MAGAHVDLEQQQVRVGPGGAQAGGPLGRLPIGHARIVQPAGDEHGGIGLRRHILVGRIAADQRERIGVGDRVAPFGPFAGGERQAFVLHGVEHVDERHVGDHRAPQRRIGIGDDPHQLAARRAAVDRDPARGCEAGGDQPVRHIDEIVERVPALFRLALQIPVIAQIVAAADMRDRKGEAAIEQRQPRGGKAGRDRMAVGAVGVEEQRAGSVARETHGIDDRHRQHRPVAPRHHQPFGGVARGIIARRDLLHLQRFELAGGGIIVVHRDGRHHRGVADPVQRRIISRVRSERRGIAGLRKRHAVLVAGICAQPDLIEPVDPLAHRQMPGKAGEPGQIDAVGPRDHRLPVARRRGVGTRDPEIDMRVVGEDPERVVRAVDRILPLHLPRADQHRRGREIGGGNQPDLVGLVVAGADHQPAAILRAADADAEPLVGLLVQRRRGIGRVAQPVRARAEGAPVVVHLGIGDLRAVRRPDDAAVHDLAHRFDVQTGGQIADPQREAFGTAHVRAPGEQPAVGADRERTGAEIIVPRGLRRLVQHQLVGPARHRTAIPQPILAAGLERPPIGMVAVDLRHRGVVLLQPALHLVEQRVDQRGVRGHRRIEIGVLGLQIVEDLRILDRGIRLVLQPVIGIRDRDAVRGGGVRADRGDGRRRQAIGRDGAGAGGNIMRIGHGLGLGLAGAGGCAGLSGVGLIDRRASGHVHL